MLSDLSAPEERFVARYGDTQILLIRLQAAVDDLERGLATIDLVTANRVDPSVRAMAFETVAVGHDELETALQDAAHQGVVRQERLRWMMRTGRHYVAPLRKRTLDSTFHDRISIGRAVNRDIVFRHGSVSKLHAWFELDDQGNAFVADAGSTNGTLINGEPIPQRELIRVAEGASLRFGVVEAVLCAPAQLWRALRTG
jgi:hypothetical protein